MSRQKVITMKIMKLPLLLLAVIVVNPCFSQLDSVDVIKVRKKPTTSDTTVYSFAEILNLFIHFELNNKELVNYSIKSARRLLKTRNKLFDYEQIVLKFMSKTTKREQDIENTV